MTAMPHPSSLLLPVAVIGAGPVGLAAAAHLIERGLPVKLYEAGDDVGHHLRDWGHVRLFSPWAYNIDRAAKRLLEGTGWQAPNQDEYPTGLDIYEKYLKPLSRTAAIAGVVETGARVTGISRLGFDKMKSAGREAAPFTLEVALRDGSRRRDLARAVIDCSGTWAQPNPLGANGRPVPGEREHADAVAYGIPDVLGHARQAYAGRRVLVVGAGHSAANALLDLAALAQQAPDTRIAWAVRGASLQRLFGGGANDQLAARGQLGRDLQALAESGRMALYMNSGVSALARQAEGLAVTLTQPNGATETILVDRIIVATGQRPALDWLRELRLDLDPAVESSRTLAPLIDPNVHSCGTVRPHGHRELAQPEPGFYIAGIKSYGRAPTFLLATGYEQVRSIAAALAGDMAAADDVQLELPQTGVCGVPAGDGTAAAGCCATPAATPDRATRDCCAPACCSEPAPALAVAKAAPKQSARRAACCG